MKISSNSPVGGASSTKKKGKTSSAGGGLFAGLLDGLGGAEESASAESTASLAPISALDSLLSVQEVSDEEAGNKQAARQGGITLDMLEELRMAILLGEVNPTQLERIGARIGQQKLLVMDPAMKEIMNEIEVRAAVELAKFGR